jgi:hypothetical protein
MEGGFIMTGATEFLRKAKAICQSRYKDCYRIYGKDTCPVSALCIGAIEDINEADLVRKVMAYPISNIELTEQEKADCKAEAEEAMKCDYNPCDVCEDNQLDDCVYIEYDDKKSCPKVMKYKIKEDADAR